MLGGNDSGTILHKNFKKKPRKLKKDYSQDLVKQIVDPSQNINSD